MLLTTQEKIDVADISSVLVSNELNSGKIIGGLLNRNHPHLIFAVEQALEWLYELDSSHTDLELIGNYLISICRQGSKAKTILDIGGGGTVAGTTAAQNIRFLYLIPIKASDFANATDYNDPRIAGKQVEVFWKNVQDYQTDYGWKRIYTPSGFTVFVDDGLGGNAFDAFGANADAEFEVYIVHPTGTTATDAGVQVLPYTGVGAETFIADAVLADKTILMVVRATPYGVIISGTPNDTQVLYTANVSGEGRLDFAVTNPILNGEFIIVLYK